MSASSWHKFFLFSLVFDWFLTNQIVVTGKKKHLCKANWYTRKISPSIHSKVGRPDHGGGLSEWGGSKAISGKGDNWREGTGQSSSELAQLPWQRTWRVKAQAHMLQLERPVALSEERPQWLEEKEVGKVNWRKVSFALCPKRQKDHAIGLWDPTPNLRIPQWG